jgi:hypothetical protein
MYKIYLISASYSEFTHYKIGWTKRDPFKRLKELKTANSLDLTLEYVFETKWGPKIESSLHRFFSKKRCEGEWFQLDLDEVESFKDVCKKTHDNLEMLSKENTWIQNSSEFSKYL